MIEILRSSLSIELPWPISLGSYYRPIVMGGHAKIVRTREGRDYADAVADTVYQKVGRISPQQPLFVTPVRIDVELRAPDRRTRDIDNHVGKSLFDSLTKAHVWADDSLVREMTARFGLQKRGGCAMVIITTLDQPAGDSAGTTQEG